MGTDVDGGLGPALEIFDTARPRLFGIAYRMLGSVAEAEDIVQEAWLRWQQTDRDVVRNPQGFLTTVTTRLAINTADSARVRRERYVGPWLPEPVDTSADPTLGAERAEALEAAVLMLLETLPARERAAYVLREAFDYPYGQLAELLETSEANARQLVSRARRHVGTNDREPVTAAEHRRLLDAFVQAAQEGDLEALERLLAEDVVSLSDGAGVVRRAARIPVVGRSRVAKFLVAFAPSFWPGTEVAVLQTNGRPSVLIRQGDQPVALLTLRISSAGIHRIMWVMVPDKLGVAARG
ncbi:RNA polymerase sigma-70 factor [Microlunatus panaciterrae]|uniref:RNA polymerase sigma-70 factor (ECF subfamily) n=1 Tax=Microlunatus panaciterrae TaxID=400768 RepID=A0ABS2RM29_9ACTN|nr:RNA polymerase sigma-70 factor [Microlunatus panaciterrae]MBM7800064.1 RNA polymerase sigma-70 factor (ECF subfamily) [Microlunatus panaciterrae]